MSTIGRRIETAIKHLVEKDYENGLIQVCIAIDGTAKKKWPRDKPGMRIRKFVDEYEALIWQFASGGGIKLLGSGRARGKISITDETPDLLYQSIRCALHHGDELSDRVTIRDDNNIVGVDKGRAVLNAGFVDGLLFSVVLDPANRSETCDPALTYSLNGSVITINDVWGDLNTVKRVSGYMKLLSQLDQKRAEQCALRQLAMRTRWAARVAQFWR